MDYDGNDFQGQNLHLADEGNSKISPVLCPYALPKFDFDDSLHGHLRFDSLVENEVFLGIPSQEDNQWIEEFSRGNTGIEFSSSAPESCSILRHNNVWSEATSSESVAMLLKSVGQEEMVPEETIVEESNKHDELGSLTEQMESNSNQDEGRNDAIDSHLALPPDESLQPISGLNESAEVGCPVGGTSQTQEAKLSGREGSSKLDPSDGSEKFGFDRKCSENQFGIDISVNGSLDNIMPIGEMSSLDVIASVSKLNNQQMPKRVSDIIAENSDGVPKDVGERVEAYCDVSKEANLDIGSPMQIPHGKSSSIEKGENFLVSDCQLDSEASVSNSEAFLLSGTGDNHVGDVSNLTIASSSSELLGEEHAIENLKGVNDASGIHKDSSNAEDHVFPSMVSGSMETFEEDIVSKEGDVYYDQNVSLNAKGVENLPSGSRDMDYEAAGSLSTDKRIESPSLGKGVIEKDLVDQGSECDTSSRNEPALDVGLESTNLALDDVLNDVPLLSASGASADEATDYIVEERSPSLVGVFMHLDKNEETKVEVSTEASLLQPKVCSDGVHEQGFISGDEKGASHDSVDQSLPMETCNAASQSEQAAVSNEVCREDSKELEVSPVLSVLKVKGYDNAEVVVIQNLGEGAVGKTHEVSSSEAEVLLPSEDEVLREPISIALVESCCSKGQTGYESNEAIAVSGINDCGQIVPSTEVDTSNDRQGSAIPAHLAESESYAVLEGGGRSTNSDKANCGSPTIISSTGPSQSEKDWQIGVPLSPDKRVSVSKVSDGDSGKVQSTSQNLAEIDAAGNEKVFTFVVLSESETSKGLQSFPPIHPSKISTIVEESPSTSVMGQTDPKMAPKISRESPQAVGGENSQGVSKGATERKRRRVSGKTTGKDNARKGNHVKETTPARNPERGDKAFGVISIPASNLPDLNSSTLPSVLFPQSFTDLQQVQLRAQIFVYGSLIQGTTPDEACMISAFGTSDGGRSVWEPAWRSCLERIHGQKSHPNNSETPLQSHSGSRAADRAIKQGPILQSKLTSSPVGRATSKSTTAPVVNSIIPPSSPLATSKSTASPVVNSIIPPSSPLWNMSSDGLQSDGMARGPLLDYHQVLSSSHPYPAQPTRNFIGHNASWLSQFPFPGAWAASPQTSSFNASARFPVFPSTESVKLTPIKESSTKHVSSSPVVHSGVPSLFAGTCSTIDIKKVGQSLGQRSADTKSRKRKKVSVSEDLGQISLPVRTHTESTSALVVTGHLSTSIVSVAPTCVASNSNSGKIVTAIAPNSSYQKTEKVVIAEETLSKVEEAKLQAENADTLAASAVNHSQFVWSQLDKQKTSGLTSDFEVKLSSSAVAIAAAATVAKAAAAAARIASNAALQAKLMADEALCPTESASAASKHAENLDAVVKATELAAEAVSQAGWIVAMGDPLRLSELVKAGSDGYWKVPEVPSEQGVKSNMSKEQSNVDRVEEAPGGSAKHSKEGSMSKKEIQISREAIEDHVRLVDGVSGSVTSSEKDLRGGTVFRASDLDKTIGVVPESEIGPRSASTTVLDENMAGASKDNSIKEGYLVEVFKDGDDTKAAWFLADILSLKDGKAFVCYNKLQSDEGRLKEWVALKNEGNKAPQIRIAHPITATRFEGTRKRRRAAMDEYAWSIGDRVDAWIQDSWREGVVMEKNAEDETTLTVRFPAEGETSVVRPWHLRPTLIWKDGEWIEWSSSRRKDRPSQGETPQEKRLKSGAPAIEGKEKEKMTNNVESVGPGKPEESHLLPLSAHEKVFNVGARARDQNKSDLLRTMQTGLHKEGSKVIFGVPKPGKKRKFMEVSKHYVAEGNSKNNELTDSVKIAKYLMPQGSGSRGWRNNSKTDFKEKRADESKSKGLKSGKPESVFGRTIPQKDKFLSSGHMTKDSMSIEENESEPHNPTEIGSEGPFLFSSQAVTADAPKKMSTSIAKSERANRGKLAPSGGKSSKPEVKDKVYNGNFGKSISEVAEPRRSNRRIQPTSRLLEGLQSSLIIPKLPTSHDRSSKGQSRK